jgi:GT2 family glycosyltransferase
MTGTTAIDIDSGNWIWLPGDRDPDLPVPDVSILLVSWNTRDRTERCLRSLAGAVTDGSQLQVVVVDNGSHDGSAEMLAGLPDLEFIRNDRNLGYAAAVNQAYRQARGELVLLLNSDVVCHPGAISALVAFLRERPDAAGVAPRYVDETGAAAPHHVGLLGYRAALALATAARWLPGCRRAWRAYQLDGTDLSRPRPVGQPAASCLLLRRSVLPPGQVFDESFPLYFNDVRLAHELAAGGHQLWMTPDALVSHDRGSSTRLLDPATRTRHHLAGLVRYVGQTQPRHRLHLLRALVFADRSLRWLLGVRGQLRPRDLAGALRGDPGELPGAGPREWVVYLSGIELRVGAHRQHALARELARDRRVLFVEPPGIAPRWRFAVTPVGPSLWRATVPTVLPFGRQLPPVNWLNRRVAAALLRRWLGRRPGDRLMWIDEDLAGTMAGHLDAKTIVYDAADLDWTFTSRWNRWHLQRGLRHAVAAADVVLTSSSALRGRLPVSRRPAVVLPNACDPDRFEPVGPVARWATGLPRPLLGYVGAIDTRAFDAELVAAVARLRPDWTFLIVGPSSPDGRRPLEHLTNVVLHDPVPFADVPAILRACDACLIPYRLGGLIDYVHPKKCYEYLALGKPVVATPLPALTRLRAPLHLAAGAPAFVQAVERALHTSHCPVAAARRRAVAVRNSWAVRGARLRWLLAQPPSAR